MPTLTHILEAPRARRKTGAGRHATQLAALMLASVFAWAASPAPASAGNTLAPDQILGSGQALWSATGYSLWMQADGNLVLVAPGNRPIWSSRTAGYRNAIARMQLDGNLVVIAPGNRPVWSSRTPGKGPARLVMQDDGNAVVYGPSGATWATNTAVAQPAPGVGATYPLARRGRIIGTPYAGTHRLGNWQSDNAVDIAIAVGTPMIAVDSGVVVKVLRRPQSRSRFSGDQITIRSDRGNAFFYAHGMSVVNPGQRVARGQVLGNSGSANGVAHLHFAVAMGDPRSLIGQR